MEAEGRQSSSSHFAALLRHYRLAAGLSQQALAERARLSLRGINALECGYRRTPQRETLALLSGALALDETQRKEFETAAARPNAPRRRAAGSVTVGPWADAEATPLPFALTTFVGRQNELDEIATLVREHRLVTLTGAGGVGKTQTALHVATATDGASDGAICFVGLAPIADPTLVLAEIASALGVQEVPNRPLLETVVAFLKNKSLLLILDNCEHVVEEAAKAADALLLSCPRVRILATSRESLRTAGERTYRLPSLNLNEASALFADRARAADSRFEITDESAAVAGELCRRLDGIPLAIELAAARVKFLSLNVLLAMLENRFKILIAGGRTALPRLQTMRAAIDWSYDLLTASEQRVFERLSVFAHDATLSSAVAVCGGDDVAESEVFDDLSSLVDKSLVIADLEGSEPRYKLLESFREYARERLTARGEKEDVARRHARVYLEVAKRLNRALDFDPDAIRLAAEEFDNWRVALQWALVNRGDIVLGQLLASTLEQLWYFSPVEGRRYVALALESIDELTPLEVTAAVWFAESQIARILCEHNAQLESSRRAIARYTALGDTARIVRAQALAGHALLNLGRLAEAKTLLLETLALARRIGNNNKMAFILRCLGLCIRDDLSEARGYLLEALEIYNALGFEYSAAATLTDIGLCEAYAGNAELALRHAAGALPTLRAVRFGCDVEVCLNNMSGFLVTLKRYDEAEAHAREALDVAREHRSESQAARALHHLAASAVLRSGSPPRWSGDPHARAARVLGYVDAHLAAMGSPLEAPTEQQEHDHVLGKLRDTLGTDELAKLMADGAAMTEERVVAEALET